MEITLKEVQKMVKKAYLVGAVEAIERLCFTVPEYEDLKDVSEDVQGWVDAESTLQYFSTVAANDIPASILCGKRS